MIFVGSLGTQAVASVGVASQLHFFVFGLLSAVTTGTVALVARETGAENMSEVGKITSVSGHLGKVRHDPPRIPMFSVSVTRLRARLHD